MFGQTSETQQPDADMISLLSSEANGQEDRQRFISLCHAVYLIDGGAPNKRSVAGDVLSNHVPMWQTEAKQAQNSIQAALQSQQAVWRCLGGLDTVHLKPNRKFRGRTFWGIKIYFGMTQRYRFHLSAFPPYETLLDL